MTLRWYICNRNDGLRDELATDQFGNPLYMITVEQDGSAILHAAGDTIQSHEVRKVIIEWVTIWHFDNIEQARKEVEIRCKAS